MRNVFGLIYAAEENLNLRELVMQRSVAALPVGGRYRAIDFLLSNMVNSGIRNVGVITQKNYKSLMDHVTSGKEWDLSRKTNGLFMLPPFDREASGGAYYHGMCDAINSKADYLRGAPQNYCLLAGSYTVYGCVYDEMERVLREKQADVVMMYNVEPAPPAPDQHFKDVRLTLNEDGRVTDVEYDPAQSASDKLGMDVYLMDKALLEYLVQGACARGNYNFVTDVLIPHLSHLRVYAVRHQGFVGRLHSASSYYDLNMALLREDVRQDLFHSGHPVFTKAKDEPPARYLSGARVRNSLVGDGSLIDGELDSCVLGREVTVAAGASLKGCIVMQGVEIQEDCQLENVIIDKNAVIHRGRRLVGAPQFPVIIRKGAVV